MNEQLGIYLIATGIASLIIFIINLIIEWKKN